MRAALCILSLGLLAAASDANLNVYRRHRAMNTRKRDTNALPSGWQTLSACTVDNPRVLISEDVWNRDSNTPSDCATFCDANGYTYAGVEYGSECHCARAVDASLLNIAPTSDCNMPCAGDASQTCGAGWRIQLYYSTSTAGWDAPLAPGWSTAYACAVDSRDARSLCDDQLNSIDDINTPAVCTAFCAAAGYAVAGVEYGQECHCGTGLLDGVQAAPITDCYQACTGDDTLNCGAPDRIQIYTLDGDDVGSCPNPTSSLSSSTSSTSSSTSSTSTSASTTTSSTSTSTSTSTTSTSTSSTTSTSTSTFTSTSTSTTPTSTSTSTSTTTSSTSSSTTHGTSTSTTSTTTSRSSSTSTPCTKTTTTTTTTTAKTTTTTKPCNKTTTTTSTTTTKPTSTTTSTTTTKSCDKPTSTTTSTTTSKATTTSTSTSTTSTSKPTTPATALAWGQCGGLFWYGPTACPSGYKCSYVTFFYSWCAK